MREIKFRAWNKRRWLHDNEWAMTPDGAIMIYHELDDEWVIQNKDAFAIDLKIVQYTGLKDKNGKEIYEADIISGIYSRVPSFWQVLEMSAFGVRFQRLTIAPFSSPTFYRDMRHTDQWRVLGNIYENPGLLKKEVQ